MALEDEQLCWRSEVPHAYQLGDCLVYSGGCDDWVQEKQLAESSVPSPYRGEDFWAVHLVDIFQCVMFLNFVQTMGELKLSDAEIPIALALALAELVVFASDFAVRLPLANPGNGRR